MNTEVFGKKMQRELKAPSFELSHDRNQPREPITNVDEGVDMPVNPETLHRTTGRAHGP
jgi:hypothetical protein